MEIRYHLKHPNRSKSSVVLSCYLEKGGKQFRFGTGITIEPIFWDSAAQRPLRKTYVNWLADTEVLDALATGLLAQKRAVQLAGGVFTAEMAVDFLERRTGKVSSSKMIDWIRDFILKNYQNTKTKDSHLQTLNLVLGWKTETSLNWYAVDNNWFSFLQHHCLTVLDLSPSTTSGHLKRAKKWLRASLAAGVHSNRIADELLLEKPKNSQKQRFSLTAEQVAKIENLQLSGSLEFTRKVFLLAVYSGLRFSDYDKVRSETIVTKMSATGKQVRGVYVNMSKTRKSIFVPLTAKAQNIIALLGGSVPKLPTAFTFNKNIRKVCFLAGLTEKVTKITTKGAVQRAEIVELWEVVGSHTARRTFATVAVAKGVPLLTVSAVLGHATIAQTETYITSSQEERALNLIDNE